MYNVTPFLLMKINISGDPQRLLTGKFLLTYREKRGKEKRENGGKRRKIETGTVENWKENWKWKEENLRGYCTPNQKLACFVIYLKNIQHIFEKWYASYIKLSKDSKNNIKI